MEEMRQLTPQKYVATLYEFRDSYEIVSAPPGAKPEDLQRLKDTFDPRAFERHQTEDLEITVRAYRLQLKSFERAYAELKARYPEYDWTPKPASNKHLQKVAQP